MNMRRSKILNSADSKGRLLPRGGGAWSGSVRRDLHDEIGVKGHTDPLEQWDRRHHSARFQP